MRCVIFISSRISPNLCMHPWEPCVVCEALVTFAQPPPALLPQKCLLSRPALPILAPLKPPWIPSSISLTQQSCQPPDSFSLCPRSNTETTFRQEAKVIFRLSIPFSFLRDHRLKLNERNYFLSFFQCPVSSCLTLLIPLYSSVLTFFQCVEY